MTSLTFDDDALIAAVDLVGRTGAREFQFGYLHDGVPVERAGWYAHAQFRGARITEEDHRGPLEAIEALARRLMTGGRCTHCQGVVTLSDQGVLAFPGAMTDGTTWSEEDIRRARPCRWRRVGKRWERGCGRDQRRSSKKSKRGRR